MADCRCFFADLKTIQFATRGARRWPIGPLYMIYLYSQCTPSLYVHCVYSFRERERERERRAHVAAIDKKTRKAKCYSAIAATQQQSPSVRQNDLFYRNISIVKCNLIAYCSLFVHVYCEERTAKTDSRDPSIPGSSMYPSYNLPHAMIQIDTYQFAHAGARGRQQV